MGIKRDGDEIVLRGGSEKAFLAAVWSVFLLIGVSGVAVGEGASGRVTGLLLIFGPGWVFIRLLRVQVRATPDELVIRGLWRSRTLRWSEVVRAEVAAANPAIPLFGILQITDASGHKTKVDGVGNWLPTSAPDRLPVAAMAAEINRRAPPKAMP